MIFEVNHVYWRKFTGIWWPVIVTLNQNGAIDCEYRYNYNSASHNDRVEEETVYKKKLGRWENFLDFVPPQLNNTPSKVIQNNYEWAVCLRTAIAHFLTTNDISELTNKLRSFYQSFANDNNDDIKPSSDHPHPLEKWLNGCFAWACDGCNKSFQNNLTVARFNCSYGCVSTYFFFFSINIIKTTKIANKYNIYI